MSGPSKPPEFPDRPSRLPLFLEVPDLQAMLGVRSERTIQRWIRAGKLGRYTELGKLRIRRDEFWKAMRGRSA